MALRKEYKDLLLAGIGGAVAAITAYAISQALPSSNTPPTLDLQQDEDPFLRGYPRYKEQKIF